MSRLIIGTNRQILGLDLLRFFAAFLVMALHLGFWSWWPTGGSIRQAFPGLASYPELVPLTWFGWVGVQIFFVLSGFVIAYSAASATPLSFFRSRFVRLMPGVWICGTLTLAALTLSAMPAGEALTRWAATMVLLPYPRWVDGVYWSLLVEIVFYAIVLGLLLRGRFDRIGLVMGALGLGSAAYALAGLALPLPQGTPTSYLLVEHGVHFALGVFLWLWLVKGEFHPLVLAALLAGGGAEVVRTASRKVAMFEIDADPSIPLFVWLIAVVFIAASVRFNDRLRMPEGLTRNIGLATYPLYLLHGMVGGAVMSLAYPLGRWPALALGMTAAILASFAVALWVEPIVQRWTRERLSSPKLLFAS